MDASASGDPNAFRDFERRGGEGLAPRHPDHFERLTAQAVDPLLNAVGAGPGVRLLDVATGPGDVAGAAAGRGAEAVGLDRSTARLDQARRRHPAVEFRQGEAEALPFPAAGFDAVVSHFGMLHFAEPERVLGEMFRVLRGGGRAAFTVWASAEEAVAFRILREAVETYGDPNLPLPPGPPFFRFSEPGECRRVLLGAGFGAPSVAQIPQVWRLPGPGMLYEAIRGAGGRRRALLDAQAPAALERIQEEMSLAAAAYEREGAVHLPMPAVLASAVKP